MPANDERYHCQMCFTYWTEDEILTDTQYPYACPDCEGPCRRVVSSYEEDARVMKVINATPATPLKRVQ